MRSGGVLLVWAAKSYMRAELDDTGSALFCFGVGHGFAKSVHVVSITTNDLYVPIVCFVAFGPIFSER